MTTGNFQIRQLADELQPPQSGKQSIVLADNANTKVVLFAFLGNVTRELSRSPICRVQVIGVISDNSLHKESIRV